MADDRNCPKCGTPMSFRLGEYECPQCGHYEAQIKEAQPQQESSGPGFKQPWQGGAARPGAVVPPPPAAGTLYQPGQQITPGGPGHRSGPDFELYPSLNTEMAIYFGLHVVVSVVLIIAMMVIGGMSNALGQYVSPGMISGIIAFAIAIALLRLAVVWFVLYGDVIWIKWCCGGCTALGILGSLPAMFTTSASALESPWIAMIDIALSIWFLTIVYRDIQRRQSL